ncbi:type II toxin-antitoxin system VapC family toxin [Sphingomonas radiodurans]|uniref:type II toxin-antitoxin system VapC family toxin n=1 Tax=Sphingomonas radiodurans TaxID=2890321 RepID=UPI001E657B8A|nr:type II toxin-antitoxin system VapC family toxin [Sphingomonas radiodurans]WBH17355.1 type II toxin-antitoxin system VapC family toxin [Sphingomonas radiodurans]
MKLLLDTHVVVWLISEPARLNATERAAIGAADSELIVSAVSVWEVRAKWLAARRSNRVWHVSPRSVIDFALANGVALVSLPPEACAAEPLSDLAHGDPFDEMLLVHAGNVGARLLTRDGKLAAHPLAYHP